MAIGQAELVGRFDTGPFAHTLLLGLEHERYNSIETLLRSAPRLDPFTPDLFNSVTDFTAEDTIQLGKGLFSALALGELKTGEFKNLAKVKVDIDDHILYDCRTSNLFYDADGLGRAPAMKFAVLDKAAITHADILIGRGFA